VAGGRAGAAALDGGNIYFDVLAMSYRSARGTAEPYAGPETVSRFFAHEAHHLGLGSILEELARELDFDPPEERAFELLRGLVMEGSATYLINADRSLERMRADPQFTEPLGRGLELLGVVESVLGDILDRGLAGEELDRALAPMLGAGWHTAGALLLEPIDRAYGLPTVMAVLEDPRQLIGTYNGALERLGREGKPFDAAIARRLTRLGE
jgi:hypothetical protein